MSRAATVPTAGALSPVNLPESPAPAKHGVFDGMKGLRRNRAIRAMYVKAFRAMQSLGVSVTPVHFYFPVPNLNQLQENFWPGGRGESVVDYDIPAQLDRLNQWSEYAREWEFDCADCDYEFHLNNGFFETVDAEIAYSILRERKPSRVIEVGGGNSTRLLATAIRKNKDEGAPGELLTIEPEPDGLLKGGFPGLTKAIKSRVQDVPPEFFEYLETGDVLFLDSTHVVMLGSDVVYEILELLPRLKPGVLVHFHDIFIPAEYPQKFVMNNLCFWGEQYMLQAFLCGNRDFRVIWSSSMMQLAYPKILRSAFPRWQGSYKQMPDHLKTFVPSYDGMNVWPCSFWLEKKSS